MVWDVDEPRAILDRIGKVLHVKHEETVLDPLPKRWTELILFLNEVERLQAAEATRLRDPPSDFAGCGTRRH